MATGTLTLTFDLKGGTVSEQAKAFGEIEESLVRTLGEDFGPDAWGGYEGPIAVNIKTEGKVRI